MAKQPNQKLKLLYLMKILFEHTDEEHCLTLAEIITELGRYDIQAERKSIYDDLEALRMYGLDVERNRSRVCGYFIANRTFELPELKLLVDAVQASKFITRKKSAELIKKVESLTSVHEAQLLQRQVYVANRIKTMNESIYYNIDKIHAAISQGKKVTFKYFEWVVHFNGSEKFKKQYRKNGHPYEVSPWALTWDNENYYLVAYDTETDRIKHYRVDKMYDIGVSEAKRDGQAQFKSFDMAVYSKGIFGMFSGGIETVKMQFANHLVGVVLDRFGREVFINQVDDEHFAIVVKVAVSPQFLSWVFGFGKDIKIISPQTVVDRFKQQINESLNQYE